MTSQRQFSVAKPVLVTPFLRGGKAISDALHTMAKAHNHSELVRTVRHQLKASSSRSAPPSTNIDAEGLSMTFRQVQITAERRQSEDTASVELMEEEIAYLRAQIQRHEESIENMQKMVGRVQELQTTQLQTVERAQRRVHGHRVNIERALQQTLQALQQQSELLHRQKMLVHRREARDVTVDGRFLVSIYILVGMNVIQTPLFKYFLSNYKRSCVSFEDRGPRIEARDVTVGGMFLESIYILVGMYVIQTPLFKYTIHLVTVSLDSSGKNRKWLPKFLQIFFFVHFMNICKTFTCRLSFSSSLWSLVSRGSQSIFKSLTSLSHGLLSVSSPRSASTLVKSIVRESGDSTENHHNRGTLERPASGLEAALKESAKVVPKS